MSKLFNWAAARLVAAFALTLPLAAMAVDFTGDYAAWSGVSGAVAWRGDGGNFEVSKVADIDTDGNIGEPYPMAWNNTAATTAKRFCSNETPFSAPGMLLVYDQANCAASANATFTPLNFGGLWVKALADASEGTPYSVTGSGTRYTDFGAAGYSTFFKFEKSFTIDRSSATRCYGNVSVEVASGATFTNTAALWIENNSTLAFSGAGTVDLSANGLNMNASSTLDLSAASRPTISGNVTIPQGATLLLPAGTAPTAQSPFTVCSGTLSVGGYVNVKIGNDDAFPAAVTSDGGGIVGIAAAEVTYTDNWPSVVPSGYS